MKSTLTTLIFGAILSAHTAQAAEDFPKDVQAFLKKRDGCEHFRGEVPDPPEKKRIEEISREIKRLCTGTDDKLASLKHKYAGSPEIMARLNSYESKIEVNSSRSGKPKHKN
jgi:hypothetical protein